MPETSFLLSVVIFDRTNFGLRRPEAEGVVADIIFQLVDALVYL
jgi:hypothetical protein